MAKYYIVLLKRENLFRNSSMNIYNFTVIIIIVVIIMIITIIILSTVDIFHQTFKTILPTMYYWCAFLATTRVQCMRRHFVRD